MDVWSEAVTIALVCAYGWAGCKTMMLALKTVPCFDDTEFWRAFKAHHWFALMLFWIGALVWPILVGARLISRATKKEGAQ